MGKDPIDKSLHEAIWGGRLSGFLEVSTPLAYLIIKESGHRPLGQLHADDCLLCQRQALYEAPARALGHWRGAWMEAVESELTPGGSFGGGLASESLKAMPGYSADPRSSRPPVEPGPVFIAFGDEESGSGGDGSEAPEPSGEKQLEAIRVALERSRALGQSAQRGIDALRERST